MLKVNGTLALPGVSQDAYAYTKRSLDMRLALICIVRVWLFGTSSPLPCACTSLQPQRYQCGDLNLGYLLTYPTICIGGMLVE